MTVAQAKARTQVLYSGSADELDTDTEALMLVYFNVFKNRWALEPGVDWNSLRTLTDIGTVTATDTFDLDDDITKISKQEGDYITILHTDGNKTNYTIVPADRLYNTTGSNTVAQVGRTLVFNTAFRSDSTQFGGTIRVPHYLVPDDLVADTDEIPVDDPDFICFMTASEMAAQDVTKTDQAPRLLSFANQCMEQMKQNNQSQDEEVYRGDNIFYGENL